MAILALAVENWTRKVFASIGAERSQSRSEVFWISVQWNVLVFSKLWAAAFFWSLGFMAVNGEECWGKDTSFSRTPTDGACTVDSLILSGFFASTSLIMTIVLTEYLTFVTPDRKTQAGSLSLLFWSVWASDAFWSLFNWLAFSIATKIRSEDPNSYSLSDYFIGGVPAFLLNGLFFYIVHNLLRVALKLICDDFFDQVAEKLWFCDALFAQVLAGAYYGFGPLAVSFVTSAGATSMLAVAFLNAMGTGVGTFIMLSILYWVPLVVWANSEAVVGPHRKEGGSGSDAERSSDVTVHSAIHSL